MPLFFSDFNLFVWVDENRREFFMRDQFSLFLEEVITRTGGGCDEASEYSPSRFISTISDEKVMTSIAWHMSRTSHSKSSSLIIFRL